MNGQRYNHHAFLSYARHVDLHDNGALTDLRRMLEGQVHVLWGWEFVIFQDREDLAWGQHWRSGLDEALDYVNLLIPILTEGYFHSAPCRDELEHFHARESALGRRDLILPLLYAPCRSLEADSDDPLVRLVKERNYVDWRAYRFEPSLPAAKRTLERMAEHIVGALEHHRRVVSAAPGAARAASRSILASTTHGAGHTPAQAEGKHEADSIGRSARKTEPGIKASHNPPPSMSSSVGSVVFDYSSYNGRHIIGAGEMLFETAWSRGGNRGIYLYNDPPSMNGVAIAKGAQDIWEVADASQYDFTSRSQLVHIGEVAILRNQNGLYAALKIEEIKARGYGSDRDELRFSYFILDDYGIDFRNK